MGLAEITEVLSDLVAQEGFSPIAPGHWVSGLGPVRHHFQVQPMKGGTYSFCWGFDLSTCPTFRSSRLVSKASKPGLDLVIDPVDDTGIVEPWHSFQSTASSTEIKSIAQACLDRSRTSLESVTTVADLVRTFEQRSQKSFKRFGLHNYVQTDLCWGLALIAVDRCEEGQARVHKFAEAHNLSPDLPTLKKAIEQATTLSGVLA